MPPQPTIETQNAQADPDAADDTQETQPESPEQESSEQEPAPAGKVEFNIPQGYIVPESAADSGQFDAVCTIRLDGDKLCLIKLGNTPLPGYNGKDSSSAPAEKAPANYDHMVQGIMADAAQRSQ